MKGITAILASVRAKNVPGLADQGRIAFVALGPDPDRTLPDGRRLDRIHRRFIL